MKVANLPQLRIEKFVYLTCIWTEFLKMRSSAVNTVVLVQFGFSQGDQRLGLNVWACLQPNLCLFGCFYIFHKLPQFSEHCDSFAVNFAATWEETVSVWTVPLRPGSRVFLVKGKKTACQTWRAHTHVPPRSRVGRRSRDITTVHSFRLGRNSLPSSPP